MILIRNGKIFTMAGKVYDKGEVLLVHDKIKAVGEEGSIQPAEDMEVLDVHGAWVLPGLIDAHCHVGITEEKRGLIGDDGNEGTNPITPYVRAMDAVNPMDPAFYDAMRAGITSLMTGAGSSNVVGGQWMFLKTMGDSVDTMAVKAPSAMKVSLGENPKTCYGDNGNMPSTRMGIAGLLREELFGAKQYYKKKKKGKLDEENFKMECWIPVFEKEIPLKVHAHRTDDILTALRIGKEFGLDLTLEHCTEGHLIAEYIKKSGAYANVGPSFTSRSKIEVQNLDFRTAGILHQHGVPTAIISDHPVTPIQYLPIYAGFAVKEGLPMMAGLEAITITAAKICRADDRVGSIEVGKDADIAVFSGNPMEVFTKTLYTIINGKIVYKQD